ncbi:Galactokinase [Podosphaera aphanis]|nr:Galactokinase [Podosphaera aphanis]
MIGNVPIVSSLQDLYSGDAYPTQMKRWQNLVKKFNDKYNDSPSFVSRSPGRVNIIGEHIDYSLYGVLPMAITADTLLAVLCSDSLEAGSCFRAHISNVESEKFPSRSLEIPYDTIEIDATLHEWTNYVKAGIRGAAQLLKEKHGDHFKPKSMKILVDGAIPVGGGLSSSAALVSATVLAVLFANGETFIDKKVLTEIAITSEHAVGVNSGGMDQSASIFSLRGSALYVSFVPDLTATAVHFPRTNPETKFLIAQSFVQSEKHVTAPVCYNLRVVECSLAAVYLSAVLFKKRGLSIPSDSGPLGVSLRGFQDTYFSKSSLSFKEQLKEMLQLVENTLTDKSGYTREEIAKVIGCTVKELNTRFMSTFPVRAERFLLRQRALHVFSEAYRVLEFLTLLEDQVSASDADCSSTTEVFNQGLGNLMNTSQGSCRELYDCSCPEIEELCSIARDAGAYGSRLTGAGWGGCTVHLVPSTKVETIRKAWEELYYKKRELTLYQKENAVVVTKPESGSAIYVFREAGWV